MILIISDVGGSVNDVIDWIVSKGETVHRLNPFYNKNILINEIQLNNDFTDIEFTYNDHTKAKLSDYDSIWVWHSNLKFNNADSMLKEYEDNEIIKKINHNLEQHHKVLISYLDFCLHLKKDKVIGNYGVQSLNKLEVIHRAKNLGIDVPNSSIVTSKSKLMELLKLRDYITKPYYESTYLNYSEKIYQNYTSILTDSDLKDSDEELFPTLIQEKIDKEFELRIFYLMGQFFSMAIFSQQSSKTEVDFRNYNFENPNRNVPFILPKEIERKLECLFNELNLNSGSVDMIYSKDHKYIFLEINPVGQFGMVSFPCNYYLEEILAKKLIDGKC